MVDFLDGEVVLHLAVRDLEAWDADHALPEPFVFGHGVVEAFLESEDTLYGGYSADRKTAVAGETVVGYSMKVSRE